MCFLVSHTFANVTGEENRLGWQLMVMLQCCLVNTGLWQHPVCVPPRVCVWASPCCVCGCLWMSSVRPPTVQSFPHQCSPQIWWLWCHQVSLFFSLHTVHETEIVADVCPTCSCFVTVGKLSCCYTVNLNPQAQLFMPAIIFHFIPLRVTWTASLYHCTLCAGHLISSYAITHRPKVDLDHVLPSYNVK